MNAAPHNAPTRVPYVRAGALLLVASLGWALTPVFIRGFKEAYDPYSQAFLRFVFATLVLMAYCLLRHRAETARLMRSRSLLGIGLVNAVLMWVWTVGAYGSTATVAQLVTRLSLVVVVAASFLFYREERAVIRNPRYIFGSLLSLGGLAAVLLRDPVTTGTAMIFLLLTAIVNGVYIVWSKHAVRAAHPLPMFAVVALHTTWALGLMALLFGDPTCIVRAGWPATAGIFLSGVICIAATHPAFNYAQKHLGSAMATSLNLINPLFTYAIALSLWSDEKLNAIQWAGVTALFIGIFLTAWAGRHTVQTSETDVP